MVLVFIRKYILFAGIIFLISLFPVWKFCHTNLQIGIMFNYLIFFVLVFISTLMVYRSIRNKEKNIFNGLLIAMAVKMLLAIIYFWIVFPFYSSDLLIFTFSFFIYYLVFSIFEVSFLVGYLNKNQEKAGFTTKQDENSAQQ